MSRANSGRRPPSNPNSIEAKYLKSNVGPILVRALAEIVERRPNDPIEYLATFLYKQVENKRAEQQKENEIRQMEIEKIREEQEKEHRAQMKKEIRALREKEANERKQREAEETKRREAEEAAKRHKEMAAAMAPTLPAVREEEDETTIVEFGNTELHRQAAHKDVNLSKILRENYQNIASRNAQGKTARDVAVDAGLQENVDQIDQYCLELLQHGNTKAINDLLLYGYTELIDQLKKSDDLSDESKNFLNDDAPQFLDKVKQFQRAIKEGDLPAVENLVNERKNVAYYRDNEGSSSLHDAIENRHFDLAAFLIPRYPNLSQVKDVRERTPIDLINSIDEDALTDEQRENLEQLKEILQIGANNQEEQ